MIIIPRVHNLYPLVCVCGVYTPFQAFHVVFVISTGLHLRRGTPQ